MRNLITLLVILVVAAAAFFAGRLQTGGQVSQNAGEAERQSEARLNKLQQRLTRLEQRNLDVVNPQGDDVLSDQASRISQLEEKLVALTKAVQSEKEQETLPGSAELDDAGQQSAAEPGISIDEMFQNETVDQSWSPNAATQVDEIFAKPELSMAQVTNVDCRSTMCSADIATPAAVDQADFEIHLLSELTSVFRGGVNLRREQGPGGEVLMKAYMVREGHQLPPPQPVGGGGIGVPK